MLMKNGKILICFAAVMAFCLSACVPPPDLKLAQDAQMAGNLEAAYGHYMKVLQADPKNVEANKAVTEIRAHMTNRARQEAAGMLQGSSGMTAVSLNAAIARLDQYRAYDPQGTYLDNDRRKYQQSLAALGASNRDRENQARQAMAAGDFSVAQGLIDAINANDPSYAKLGALQADYKRSRGAHLEKRIMDAYAAGKVDTANAAMKEWLGLGFSADKQARMKAAVKDREISILKETYQGLLKKHQYFNAFLLLNKSQYKDAFARQLSKLRNNGAAFYLDQARRRFESGNVSRAYIEAVKGFELNAEHPGLFEIHRDTRDKVLEGVQKYIAIPAFGSPKDNPDVGTQFSDALISYLFRILPYGINIVERGKIDMLIEEHKREYSEVANILNVDLIVTGNVSLLNIDRQDNQRKSTVRVPVGSKIESNPAYEAFMRANPGSDQSGAPPRTIKVQEFGNFTINKGRSVIKGFSSVAVRIFDTGKGRITYAQEFNANFQATDDYQDALELAGMEGDPLDLPSDTEVREKLRNQIVQQLAGVVQAQFEKREKDFMNNARFFISRRETNKAIDELARGFLYCVKAKVKINDPDYTDIRNTGIALTEKDFLL